MLEPLTQLEELHLVNCKLTKLPRAVTGLTDLKVITKMHYFLLTLGTRTLYSVKLAFMTLQPSEF